MQSDIPTQFKMGCFYAERFMRRVGILETDDFWYGVDAYIGVMAPWCVPKSGNPQNNYKFDWKTYDWTPQ